MDSYHVSDLEMRLRSKRKTIEEDKEGDNPNTDKREALVSHFDGRDDEYISYADEKDDEEYKQRMLIRHQQAKEEDECGQS